MFSRKLIGASMKPAKATFCMNYSMAMLKSNGFITLFCCVVLLTPQCMVTGRVLSCYYLVVEEFPTGECLSKAELYR